MDNGGVLRLFPAMAQPETKYVKPFDFVVDAILVGAFFVFMFFVLRPHVPSNDAVSVFIWAGLTSACMSGVFWLCCWMFRMVARHQKVLNARK